MNQLYQGTVKLTEHEKHLLECNLTDLATTNGEQQEYWFLAAKVARTASLLHQQAEQQLDIAETEEGHFVINIS